MAEPERTDRIAIPCAPSQDPVNVAAAVAEVAAIAELISLGDDAGAKARIQLLTIRHVRDSALHLRLADLCEELGMGDRLILELNDAFRDAPEELDLLRRLAQVHHDAGRTERAIKCWRALSERAPDDVEVWEELGALLTAHGFPEEARDAYTRGLQTTGDRRFEGLLRSLQSGPKPSEGAEAEAPLEDALLARFVTLFSGREGLYARQWVNPQGQTGYTPVREPFNIRVARNHLLGNHTVGIYPVRLDNTVNFAAFDLDLAKGLVERSGPGRPDWETAMAALEQHARRLVLCARERGLEPCLADSGSKGRHIWFFFAEPLRAGEARRLLQALDREVAPPPLNVNIEIFPKQSNLPPNGLGNLIKIPLGIHKLSGRRVQFLDLDGTPIADQHAWLMTAPRTSRDTILRYLEQVAPRTEEENPSAPWEGNEEGGAASPRPALQILQEYHPDDDITLQTVLGHCVTLRTLVNKAETERALTHDEVNVLLYTLGHLENGPQAVNSLLRKCPTVDSKLYLKSRLRGNPISCPSIRKKIPSVTAGLPCNCEFATEAGLYPNPLLHLQASSPPPGTKVDTLQFQALLSDFLRARQALHAAERVHRRLADQVNSWFDQAGIDEFQTPMGLLKRTKNEDGGPRFILDV